MSKQYLSRYVLFLSIVLGMSSCEAIGAIFKAGVWSGIILVVLVVALIIFIVSRMGNKK